MKKFLLSALPLLALLAVSCKKDNGSKLPEPEGNTDEIIEFKDPNFLKVLLTCECAYIKVSDDWVKVNMDFNKDGKISVSEAQKVIGLQLCDYEESYGIKDISEIKYFSNLITLDCTDNQLTSLDVSNNVELGLLNCGRNQLTSLDVSNNVALTVLDCNNNQLTYLDLGKNTLLEFFFCNDNKLTKIILPSEHSIPDEMIESIIEEYGDIIEGGKQETGSRTYTDLSLNGTANCYVVSTQGDYKFKAVKGNTDVSVGKVNSVEVLWESFGTDMLPDTGDIIASASFENGYICFSTPDISSDPLKVFPKGNAVIAAKDSDGNMQNLQDGLDCVYSWFGKKDGYATFYMELSAEDEINPENLEIKSTGPIKLLSTLSEDKTMATFQLQNTLTFGRTDFEIKYHDDVLDVDLTYPFSVTSKGGPGIDADFSLTYRYGDEMDTVKSGDMLYLVVNSTGVLYAKGGLSLHWTSKDEDLFSVTPAPGKGDEYWATVIEFKTGSEPCETSLILLDQQGNTLEIEVGIFE